MSSLADNGQLQCMIRHHHKTHSSPSRSGRIAADSDCRLERHLWLLESFAQLLICSGHSLEEMLGGFLQLLPSVWRYPEVCCARAVVREQVFATLNWRESPWMLVGEICVHGVPVGMLQVGYLTPRPDVDNGPFTREERLVLNFAAAVMGKTTERLETVHQLRETVEQLQLERTSLQQANAALRVILDRIDEERKTTRRTITANVDKAVMPVVRALEAQAPLHLRSMVDLLKSRLEEVASPFVDNLSRAFTSLTPLEISLCRMIRDDLTTKEIARIRHVSPSTVARQREQIRRKLGISGSDTNLATYLRTFLADAEPGRSDAGPCERRLAM